MMSLKINGGIGGAGGRSPNVGGKGGRGGGPRRQSNPEFGAYRGQGGIGGAGGEGGNLGGEGGHGETADMTEPLLSEDELNSLPPRMDLKTFCDEYGIETAIQCQSALLRHLSFTIKDFFRSEKIPTAVFGVVWPGLASNSPDMLLQGSPLDPGKSCQPMWKGTGSTSAAEPSGTNRDVVTGTVYAKLGAEGYRNVSAAANASPLMLKDDCGLKSGHINELKTAMKVLIKKLENVGRMRRSEKTDADAAELAIVIQ
ncbi:hypothetical protein FB45DRAFT_1010519 [Roridomyces roridus]|uniref:Uncharacterized protein n=1 Tax=Roridomyces roridus TaxID=1738132 RepID=A0AAD7FAP8_9AGAR|nr:hypothetical protein FB45DRAFT_1010519 [Roridomyces roridus]